VEFDGVAAEHFVALEDYVEALTAHIFALVLEPAFGENDHLAQ